MSLEVLKAAINNNKVICPKCSKAVQKYDKFIEMVESVWDGAGDTGLSHKGSKVTLICANEGCSWSERTEFWESYIEED